MAAMEGVIPNQNQHHQFQLQPQQFQQQQQQQQPQPVVVERLNDAVQQQLNLESVKTRASSLFKSITRILEDFDLYARTNTSPKWQDIMGQYSMVNLELFNIVDEIKKVSKAFVVHPKNVNAENATILPVMLSSKLLPEMETEDNAKRDQLLHGMQNLSVTQQIEKLKARIDMIGAACESAEKVLADTRLRLPGDQRQVTPTLPVHLVDVLSSGDGMQTFSDSSGMYHKNTPPSANNLAAQSPLLQNQLPQLHDLQGQTSQKFQSLHGQQQMQFSQSMGQQQFQGRQLSSGHLQHGIGQSQLNQGSQINRQLNQFSSAANSAMFNAAQTTANPQMIPNMSGTMSSSSILPRMQQFGLTANNPQRNHTSQILSDQMFNMGAGNPGSLLQQQQQHNTQGAFGNMTQNAQNLQSSMATLQSNPQSHPNFGQQRQQNQQ
ncbi:hypothetical protein F8388_014989 [Cannabis sativa]|uniref:Mediator of RNA polymerase II transcription subunit 8 n=1 Tax=Cannabis sativa TaxID=3483 RepID=A0A7J6FKV7_CANSA|nr:hypothetical protein F8388_014989 [Cannabis sativa]KAF4371342.1 hypothetical protein G4B88_003812 [Cannabis sativa]